MEIIWDDNKNIINIAKHSVSFELAQQVFDDPLALSRQDRIENGEERWQTIGTTGGIAIVLVAHTYLEQNELEVVRIISARKATKIERKAYEQGK